MPESAFRYVAPSKVQSYCILGWSKIGTTLSPHDCTEVAVMEWTADGPPVEPVAERTSLAAVG